MDLLLALVGENEAIKEEFVRLYVDALRAVWWLLLAVSCCCLVSTIFIKDVNMDEGKTNNEIEHQEDTRAESQAVECEDDLNEK